MNTINPGTVGHTLTWTPPSDVAGTHSVEPSGAGALQKLLLQLDTVVKRSGPDPAGLSDDNGAPQIDGVTVSVSPQDAADVLRLLGNKTQDAQLKTAREGLETAKLQSAESHKAAMAKLEENLAKLAESKKAELAMGILGWVAKGVGLAAAVIGVAVAAVAFGVTLAAAIGSGGVAIPLAVLAAVGLTMSVAGLVGATVAVASGISQACGGPPLEPSALLNMAFAATLEACGMSKEEAGKLGKLLTGIVGFATGAGLIDQGFVTSLWQGGLEVAGVDPATAGIVSTVMTVAASLAVGATNLVIGIASSASTVAVQIADKGLRIVATVVRAIAMGLQGALAIAGGVAQAGTGAAGVGRSALDHQATLALVDKKKIDAAMVKLMQTMETETEEIRKLLKHMEESNGIVSQMIADNGRTLETINLNLAGTRTTI